MTHGYTFVQCATPGVVHMPIAENDTTDLPLCTIDGLIVVCYGGLRSHCGGDAYAGILVRTSDTFRQADQHVREPVEFVLQCTVRGRKQGVRNQYNRACLCQA